MLQIENLTYYYKKKNPILKDFSVKLDSGKIYGLLGLNGEGKTTLLKLIAGLIYPQKGTITIENKHITTERSKDRLAGLYMLPDQPNISILKIKDYQNIYSVFYENFSKSFFEQALADFGLNPNTKLKSLSLGQQKKFHLAFALATNTNILLLDEPTNGLDIPSKAIFRRLLAKSITEQRIIIISTHLVSDIENLIDHILIMKNGQLALDNSINDIQEKYVFDYSNQVTENILYAEKSIAQYKTIASNINAIETPVNIELLFNAIQQNKL